MKPKPFPMSPEEARHASTLPVGGKMTFVRPLKEQPPEDCFDNCENLVINYNSKNEAVFIWPPYGDEEMFARWFTKLRYPVGTLLAGKKGWDYDWDNMHITRHAPSKRKPVPYLYKADGLREFGWQSLITMPREAVRSRFKVVENRVDKCCNITMNDATLMGIHGDPMKRYIPEYPAYYLEPHITAKYGKGAWDDYAEIVTVEVQ